jgi:hypothetical protein
MRANRLVKAEVHQRESESEQRGEAQIACAVRGGPRPPDRTEDDGREQHAQQHGAGGAEVHEQLCRERGAHLHSGDPDEQQRWGGHAIKDRSFVRGHLGKVRLHAE